MRKSVPDWILPTFLKDQNNFQVKLFAIFVVYFFSCLIKHLEGLVVNYDLTVRDSDNSVIQWRYGEDGLDIPKSQLLKSDQMPFFANNIDALFSEENFGPLKEATAKDKLQREKKRIEAWRSSCQWIDRKTHRDSGFLRFCNDIAGSQNQVQLQNGSLQGRSPEASALCNLWYQMHEETKKK